jgi:hypothetical protein
MASSFPVVAECHCGTVKVEAPLPDEPLNACTCSVCARYGAVWGYYLLEQIRVTIKSDGEAQNATKAAGIDNSEHVDKSKASPQTTEHIMKTSVKAPTETLRYSHGKKRNDFHACPKCYMLMFEWPRNDNPHMGLNTSMVLNRKEVLANTETRDLYELEGRPD